jgi:ABC-type bacteriocin/lantibiotic exporter with double-glycine peptidase domain
MTSNSKTQIRLIYDLLAFAIRRRPSIVSITLLGIASSIVELLAMLSVIPLGVLASGRQIHNATLFGVANHLGLTLDARFFVATFLSLFLVRTGTFILTQVLNGYIGQSLMGDFSTRAFASFVRDLSFSDIHKHQIGHFVALAGDEANRGSQIVVNLMRLAPVVFLFLLYGMVLLYQSWQGFIGLSVFIFLTAFSMRSAFRKSLSLGHRQQEESRVAVTHFIESLSGLRTVRSFTAENFIISRYAEMMKRYTRTLFLSEAFSNLSQVPIFLIAALSLVAMALYTDNKWLGQQMPAILAGIMIFFRLLPIANQGLENALRLTTNLRAGRNIAHMLRATQSAERTDPLPDFPDMEKIVSIQFDHVAFRYANDTPKILDNFSCRLQAGKSYALVGPSGVGKSSLIDLMLKFFMPLEGAIRVNGNDISQLSSASLRRHILLSEQAIRIFHGTILENVQFGHIRNDADARQALDMVGLEETLNALPAGGDTVLTFQGSNLSGGQRQRVGIARALFRTPDVLVMDESTNALDTRTRELVLESMLTSYRDRILIFVTHDPQVISRVDEVIELRAPTPPLSAETAELPGKDSYVLGESAKSRFANGKNIT